MVQDAVSERVPRRLPRALRRRLFQGPGQQPEGRGGLLQSQNVPIAHYGIEQFEELVKSAREQGDGAAAYWDQVRRRQASWILFCFTCDWIIHDHRSTFSRSVEHYVL